MPVDLPFMADQPTASARIKVSPEHFKVDEVLGFEPDGTGQHYLFRILKINRNTADVARELSQMFGLRLVDVGYSGRKDKQAVARQWFSVPAQSVDAVSSSIGGLGWKVEKQCRHGRKLRRGSHRGNSFDIRLSEFKGCASDLEQRVLNLQRRGFPNYFGSQRFGHQGRNIDEARRILGTDAIRLRRPSHQMLLSAARSWLFNVVLGQRLRENTWTRPLPGDIMMLAGSRSHFTAEKGDSMLPERLASLDIHVSGPLWGDVKSVQGQTAWQRECYWLEGEAELRDSVARTGANPARRALRATFDDLALKWTHDSNPRLIFTLGRGCYATSLLRELVLFEQPSTSGR